MKIYAIVLILFLRRDTVKKDLSPPYHEPFNVLKETAKTFTLKITEKGVVVSIDRLN